MDKEEEEIDVDDMRYELAEQSAMNMSVGQIVEILLDGVDGLYDVADIDIIEAYNKEFKDK